MSDSFFLLKTEEKNLEKAGVFYKVRNDNQEENPSSKEKECSGLDNLFFY